MEGMTEGRIVHYRSPNGCRPMMVVAVHTDENVNGQIFLDGINDRTLEVGGNILGDARLMAYSVKEGPVEEQFTFHDPRADHA